MDAAIKPRHEAQMEEAPLGVTAGMGGFCLYHDGASQRSTVLSQDHPRKEAAWFSNPHEAYQVMRDAQGATAAMLATVFGR